MSVLIVFESVEGQTRRVAEFVEAEARAAGLETACIDTGLSPDARLGDAERVVLAAPVHERRHPKAFEAFVARHSEALNARKTLLLSVSLSAAFAETREEAEDYVTEMTMRTGLSPDAVLPVAGAVRTGAYDAYSREVLKKVVLRGQDVDPERGDHEFTDWAALKATLTRFLA